MANASIILFPGEGAWRIGVSNSAGAAMHDVPIAEQATLEQIAEAIGAELRRLGQGGAPVTLAVPSSWCMCASIDVGELHKPDRKTLTFKLEEKLPLAAEQFVADFIHGGASALGVCVQSEQVRPIVDALESAGIGVQSIAPAALLACQSLFKPPIGDQLVLWREGGDVNVLRFVDGALRSWALTPANPRDVVLQARLELARGSSTAKLVVLGLEEELIGSLREVSGDLVIRSEGLIETAARFRGGQTTPWVELRRGALGAGDRLRLYRRSLEWVLVAGIALLVALAGALLMRSARYDRVARDADERMQGEFQAAFPNWPAPASVRDVLESELRKRSAASPAAVPAMQPTSALEVMRDVLSRFPRDVRCNIDQATFNSDSVELNGRLHSYADSDAIATAARSAGLEVAPPQLRREGDGRWRFVLSGRSKRGGSAP